MFYWHKIPKRLQDAVYWLVDRLFSKLKADTFRRIFKQPDWCGYPDAIDGFGCWSLVKSGQIKSRKDCAECDLNGFYETGTAIKLDRIAAL